MPIWIVDKNSVGLRCNSNAACAPVMLSSAMETNNARRLDDKAISDMANKAFSKVNKTISKTSIKRSFNAQGAQWVNQ
jgi:hypothetical protein